jgi:exopolyphosphatase / guanosine-5'-triphosphate,3'-diphosphate pyrophosphatase
MMLLSSIDIGTNSVILLVAEHGPGGLRAVKEVCAITRLGQGVSQTGRLDPAACARTLDTLRSYAQILEDLGVERRSALGTAALREANNSAPFLQQAATVLGCAVEVISGDREAQLTLSSVQGALGALLPRTLIFDVGGGSTELIVYHPQLPAVLTSLPLGAVRLTERLFLHDPPLADEIAQVRRQIAGALGNLGSTFHAPRQLIGIGGTVTTLASVQLELKTFNGEQINGLTLTHRQVSAQETRYAQLALAERQTIVGLDPARADIILAGTLIVLGLQELLGGESFQVCDRGVRWGLLWEQLQQTK